MIYVQGTNEMIIKTLEPRMSHDVILGISEIRIIGL